jgi:hypothetical protein
LHASIGGRQENRILDAADAYIRDLQGASSAGMLLEPVDYGFTFGTADRTD